MPGDNEPNILETLLGPALPVSPLGFCRPLPLPGGVEPEARLILWAGLTRLPAPVEISADPEGLIRTRLHGRGAHESVAPRTLWPGVPVCAWFLPATSEALTTLENTARALEQGGFPVWHIGYLFFAPGTTLPPSELQRLTDLANVRTILLRSDGRENHPIRHLAEAASAHAFLGWRKYNKVQDGDLISAFAFAPGPNAPHTLGIGLVEADAPALAEPITRAAARQLADLWSGPAPAEEEVWFQPGLTWPEVARELCNPRCHRVEETYLESGGNPANHDPVWAFPDGGAQPVVKPNQDITFPGFRPGHGQWSWSARITAIRSLQDYLELDWLPYARRAVEAGGRRLETRLESVTREFLQWPLEPAGAISSALRKTESMRAWLDQAAAAQVLPAPGQRSTPYNIARIKTCLGRTPALSSVLIRLVLAGVALFWLWLGTLVWQPRDFGIPRILQGSTLVRKMYTSRDEVIHVSRYATTFALPALLLAGLVPWLWFRRAAEQAADLARADVLRAHCQSVLELLDRRLKNITTLARRRMDDLETRLRNFAPKPPAPPTNAADAPARGFQPATALTLGREFINPIALGMHERARRLLAETPPWDWEMDALWIELQSFGSTSAEQYLRTLPFDRFVETEHWDPPRRRQVLSMLVQLSRIPAWDSPAPANPPAPWLVSAHAWRDHAGQHDQLDLRALPELPFLLVLSVIPIPAALVEESP